MNALIDSLNQLKLVPLPFIAPVVTPKQFVYTYQSGRVYLYLLPEATPRGWWMVEPRKGNEAGVARRAWTTERMEYLRQLPKVSVMTILPFVDGYRALRLDTGEKVDVFLPGELMTPLVPFAVTEVRQLGNIYLYDTTSIGRDHKLRQMELVAALHRGEQVTLPEPMMDVYLEVKAFVAQMTPQERELYNLVDSFPLGEERRFIEFIPGLCLSDTIDLKTTMGFLKQRNVATAT